jgi:periplasmic divalent cation tolerance protein
MTDKILVLSTCSSKEEADKIARNLVEKRVAACVNVLPGVRSIYRWRGAVEEASECLLIVKSRRDLAGRLRAEIEKSHSYEVPEVLVLGIVDGAAAYLDWLERELEPGP